MTSTCGSSDGSSACSALSIVVLLPDILGTYSDAGNAVVLAERARRRGIPADVRKVGIGDTPPRTADLYVIGGGEDTAQLAAAAWLTRHRLQNALTDRAVVLAVCAGFQLLGTRMTDRAGHTYPGVGVLDVTTTPGTRRAVGEIATTASVPGIGRLTGFENHLGHTSLGAGVRPLGRVERGTGNGAPRRGHAVDGAITVAGTGIGTYLHGPVLARNPALPTTCSPWPPGTHSPRSSCPTRNRCAAPTWPARVDGFLSGMRWNGSRRGERPIDAAVTALRNAPRWCSRIEKSSGNPRSIRGHRLAMTYSCGRGCTDSARLV